MANRIVVLDRGSGPDLRDSGSAMYVSRVIRGAAGDTLVYPTPQRVPITNPPQSIELEIGQAYTFSTRVTGEDPITAFITAGAGSLLLKDLVPVDPSTLEPEADPGPAWFEALQGLEGVAGAVAAAAASDAIFRANIPGQLADAAAQIVADIPAVAAAAAELALSDAGLLRGGEGYSVVDEPAFSITDADGKRSWLEIAKDGGPTQHTLDMMAEPFADSVGDALGIAAEEQSQNDVSFAVLDSAGRRSDIDLDNDGKISERVMDRWRARLGIDIGAGSIGFAELKPEVTNRFIVYVPQLDAGNVYAVSTTTGDRVLLSSGSNPRDVTTTGDGYVLWIDDTGAWARRADGSAAKVPQHPTKEIACWGDSYTGGGGGFPVDAGDRYPAKLAAALGVPAHNGGYSGHTSTEIAIHQGAIRPLLTVASNQIPASGAVVVSTIDPATSFIDWDPENDDSSAFTYTWSGSLAGVPGTLTHNQTTNSWSFSRSASGAVVACPAGTPFICADGDAHRNKIQILWPGRNNIAHAANGIPSADVVPVVLRDNAAMYDWVRSYAKRVLVIGPTNVPYERVGVGGYSQVVQINTALAEQHGARYVDLRRYLIDHGLTAAGITPTSDDLADIAGDAPPRSLYVADIFHPNAAGYQVVADYLASIITSKGWLL